MLLLQNITKDFGTSTVVEAVDLEVEQGQHLAILGPSGCGKSTLLKLIAGLIRPTKGNILMFGRDITSQRTHERRVPLVFQDPLLFPHMSVADNVAFGLRSKNWHREIPSAQGIRQAVSAMLGRVQLEGYGDRFPNQLSGGQRQRVALARAMILRPPLVLLDEPLSHLDTGLRMEMRHLIKDLCHEFETTLIMVTHDPQEALSMGSMVGVMSAGRMWEVNKNSLIFSTPRWEVTARMMGFENILEPLSTPAGGPQLAEGDKIPMLRPEALEFSLVGKDQASQGRGPGSGGSEPRGCLSGAKLIRLDYEGETARAVFLAPNHRPLVWRGPAQGAWFKILQDAWSVKADEQFVLSWPCEKTRLVQRCIIPPQTAR